MTSSLRSTATSLDASPASVRELARRIRWEDGWQGCGPLSVLWLMRSHRCTELSKVFAAAGDPPLTSVREAYQRVGFPMGGGVTQLPDGPISLRELVTRADGPESVPLRFLSYNTYLLQGVQIPLATWVDDVVGWDALAWFGIPFGGALLVTLGLTSLPALAIAEILKLGGFTPSTVIKAVGGIDLNGIAFAAKPALAERADDLGHVVAEYDISCLCEVWTQDSRERMAAGIQRTRPGTAWQFGVGPDESGEWTMAGSGLLCAVRGHRVTRSEVLVYADRGSRERDSDAWSHKGAMLSVIETDAGSLEVFQTHLYYGGAMPLPEPTQEQRFAVWASELAELSTFFHAHHDPANVAILTGDFNMDGADIRTYAQLRRTTDALNLQDVWAWDVFGHSPCGGRTCRYTDHDKSTWERAFDEACSGFEADGSCVDGGDVAPPPLRHDTGVGRFDFVFVERPTNQHLCRLEVSRIRRQPFQRPQVTDGESYLSDHLGLDLTLFLSPRL
jgi:endonuclease/exonuclease/phosphatase family metal-dependent hydrolase